MPRRHRKTARSLPAQRLCACPMTPEGRAQERRRLAQATAHAAAAFAASPLLRRLLSTAQRAQLRGHWHQHVPVLARQLAPLLDEAEAPLSALAVRGADLRAGVAALAELKSIKARLDLLSDWTADLLLLQRYELHGQVEGVLGAVRAVTGSPLFPAEVRARIAQGAEPALAQLRGRREQLARKKRAGASKAAP